MLSELRKKVRPDSLSLIASNSSVSLAANTFLTNGMQGYEAVKSILRLVGPIEQNKDNKDIIHSEPGSQGKNLFDQISWLYDKSSKPSSKQKKKVLELTESALYFIADGGPHIRTIHGESYDLPSQQRKKVKKVAQTYSEKLKEVKEQGSGLNASLILLFSTISTASLGLQLFNGGTPVVALNENGIKTSSIVPLSSRANEADDIRATPKYIYDGAGNLIDVTYEKGEGYTFGEIDKAWMTIATSVCGEGTALACWGGAHVGIVKNYNTQEVAGFYEAPDGLYYLIDVDAIKANKD